MAIRRDAQGVCCRSGLPATYLGAQVPTAPRPSHAWPSSRQMPFTFRRRRLVAMRHALPRTTTRHTALAATLISANIALAHVVGAQTSLAMLPIPRNEAREQTLLQHITVANGFKATLFAAPPIAMYPVCLTATIEGAVF